MKLKDIKAVKPPLFKFSDKLMILQNEFEHIKTFKPEIERRASKIYKSFEYVFKFTDSATHYSLGSDDFKADLNKWLDKVLSVVEELKSKSKKDVIAESDLKQRLKFWRKPKL